MCSVWFAIAGLRRTVLPRFPSAKPPGARRPERETTRKCSPEQFVVEDRDALEPALEKRSTHVAATGSLRGVTRAGALPTGVVLCKYGPAGSGRGCAGAAGELPRRLREAE